MTIANSGGQINLHSEEDEKMSTMDMADWSAFKEKVDAGVCPFCGAAKEYWGTGSKKHDLQLEIKNTKDEIKSLEEKIQKSKEGLDKLIDKLREI